MITHSEREVLSYEHFDELLSKGGIGWDCDGNIIMPGDKVEVVKEDKMRRGMSEFSFCSIGAQGKVVEHLYSVSPRNWIIIVEFMVDGKPNIIGCDDLQLRKV
jgi:hypothetical protein